jgi:hypothetical protein
LASGQGGEKDRARNWFDKATAWTQANDPKNLELRQLWAEAAERLGLPGPPPSGADPAPPASPAARGR